MAQEFHADSLVTIADSLEALDVERSYGGEEIGGKCRKDKGHYLRNRPGPL